MRNRTMDDERDNLLPFHPYDTMFKLSGPDSLTVECIACRAMYPLQDLLEGELNEEDCPSCHTTASMYWAGKTHQTTPPIEGVD